MKAGPNPPRIHWSPAPSGWTLPAAGVSLWCADVDRWSREHSDETALLDDSERLRASRLRTETLRDRFVASRAILRRILGRALEREPQSVRFTNARHGKPRLEANSGRRVTFNLSRRESLVLIATSTVGEVGVDVERVRELDDLDSIAEDLFTTSERRPLETSAGPDRLRAFFTAWTRKEAVIKATGEGLTAPLQEIEIVPSEPGALRLSRVGTAGILELRPEWTVVDLDPATDYAAALTAPTNAGAPETFGWS